MTMKSTNANQAITAPTGFRVGSVHCGLKTTREPDVGILMCDVPATAAGAFTTNKVFAAPVAVCRENLAAGKARAVVVNAGNANACTGPAGMRDAKAMTAGLAKLLEIDSSSVLVASTGVIGHRLPMDKVRNGIAGAAEALSRSAQAGRKFARTIMTTDKYPKTAFRQIRVGGSMVRLAGVAKGAGMIAPNMATMLCFITTDAAIGSALLGRLLKRSIATSFNAITVDNHMSTNDTAIVLASGLAGNTTLRTARPASRFAGALDELCLDLALQMVSDGEGATKRMEVTVRGARSRADARTAAFAVANSPLVKCALFGKDPNWGRIVSAVGACPITCRQELIDCKIGSVTILRKGRPAAVPGRELAKATAREVVPIMVDLHTGSAQFRCYGCDLSHEYVHINADYHT